MYYIIATINFVYALAIYLKAQTRITPMTGAKKGRSNSILSPRVVLEIRTSKENGVQIAKRLGLTHQHVYDIRNGKLWKHLPQKGVQ